MKEYIIATVSTCDLPVAYLEEHQIPFISYTYSIGGQLFVDDCREITKQELMSAMRQKKAPSTSQITQFAYEEFFRSLLNQGKDVLFLDMDRALSSSIANAEAAVEAVKAEFPQQRLYFLDSYCATGGLAMLIKELVRQKENGASMDDLIAWGEAHKKKYIHRFMVEDLQWLRRGGRLSNASAFVSGLLAIKPKIYVGNDGKLRAYGKTRGRKRCMAELVEDMATDIDSANNEGLTVVHADCRQDAETLAAMAMEKYPHLKKVCYLDLGPVIAAHVGPDFMALIYGGKERTM